MTGVGLLALFIGYAVTRAGIDLGDTTPEQLAEAVYLFVATFMTVYGQLRRKDLVAGIIRK